MNYKKELFFSFIFILLTGFFIFNLIKNYQKENSSLPQNQLKTNQNTKDENQVYFTLDEVAKHNSKDDCWLLVRNNVYNVTSYIDKHPGGSKKIIPFCGKEATEAFMTQGKKNKNKTHSSFAWQQLESLKIGSLKK